MGADDKIDNKSEELGGKVKKVWVERKRKNDSQS